MLKLLSLMVAGFAFAENAQSNRVTTYLNQTNQKVLAAVAAGSSLLGFLLGALVFSYMGPEEVKEHLVGMYECFTSFPFFMFIIVAAFVIALLLLLLWIGDYSLFPVKNSNITK